MMRRRRAKESFAAYIDYIEVPGVPMSDDEDCDTYLPVETEPAKHHRLLFDLIDCVVHKKPIEGRVPNRVMVFMPPGSAKSTYCSVALPPYAMGQRPGFNIINASYATPLARKLGRKARSIARSTRYRNVFKTGLSKDNAGAEEWSLESGSEFMAGGLLSGITGNRADGIVIDDPVKGREAADSAAVQEKTIDTYNDDLKTRLKPNGWMFIIQTRWSQADLSGSILPEKWSGESGWIECQDGQWWYVLCIQAQCTKADDPLGRELGEYIWPEWFPESHWQQYKSVTRTWSALYQQVPAPEEGIYFKREWFQWYDPHDLPKNLHVYGASDYAVSEGKGDYTVHLVGGVDHNEDLYLLDLWRGQTLSETWIERLLDLMDQHQPLMWAEEGGQIIKGVGPFIAKRQEERRVYGAREQFTSSTDKTIRARSIQARTSQGKVYLPRNAEWIPDFLAELLVFNAGRNDDQVDAYSLLGRMIDQMIGKPEPEDRERGFDRWDEAFEELEDEHNNWKVM